MICHLTFFSPVFQSSYRDTPRLPGTSHPPLESSRFCENSVIIYSHLCHLKPVLHGTRGFIPCGESGVELRTVIMFFT